MSAEALIQALTMSTEMDSTRRTLGEQTLNELQTRPDFSATVSAVLQNPSLPGPIRQGTAVLFKNFVKKHWSSTDVIDAQHKTMLKRGIVQLMLNSPDNIRNMLMEAVTVMAAYDWPKSWPELLPELVSKLQPTAEPALILGVLRTIHAVVRRFRFEGHSRRVLLDLKLALEQLQEPLLQAAKAFTAAVPTTADRKALRQLLTVLLLIARIFYDLNAIDLPEYFEDHKDEWMHIFGSLLVYDNPTLSSDDDDTPGPVQKLQSAILKNLQLWEEKYEEEFQDYVLSFVSTTWNLITKTSLAQKFDKVVTRALQFLTVVARGVHHAAFANPDTLRTICEQVVLRNIEFSAADEEQFEENPVEYIRRDVEGAEADTRRRACSELVRALAQHYEQPVTELCTGYVRALLATYAQNPRANWKSKDSAIYLLTALAVKGSTQATGSTAVSSLVDVMDFLRTQIVPELESDPDALPVLKADCIKIVTMFRSLIPREGLLVVLSLLGRMLGSANYVVHSYAANAIERILVVRDGPTFRITRADLNPLLGSFLAALFSTMERPVSKENDFLMKALMRLLSVADTDIVPHAGLVIGALQSKMQQTATNPSNPNFTHYLFEATAALIATVCKADPKAVAQFESFLFPTFQTVLQMDVQEMVTYVLQILSQLLELNPAGAPNPVYTPLFAPLLAPVLWDRVGNIPGLVRLMQAYLHKFPQMVVQGGYLVQVLGVFQRLVGNRNNDHYGVQLFNALLESVPLSDLRPYLVQAFQVFFARIQLASTPKIVRLLLVALSVLIVHHGGPLCVEVLEGVQPGMTTLVLDQLWLPNVQKVSGPVDRKLVAVAMTKLLCETPALAPGGALSAVWLRMFQSLVRLFELPEEEDEFDAEDAFLEVDEQPGYSAAFAQLHYARTAEVDPVPAVPDPRQYLALSLHNLSRQHPGVIGPMVASDPQCAQALHGYFTRTQLPAGQYLM